MSHRRLCVFCGSNHGTSAEFADATVRLAVTLAELQVEVVYGGGSVGLMGVLADASLEAGNRVTGVITDALVRREVAHDGLTELRVVSSMHERKAVMAELSDGFIMLPGGYGTLDEFCEALTWTQLGIHAKPCGVLDVGGYFSGFLSFLDHATANGFIRAGHRDIVRVAAEPADLVAALEAWEPEPLEKWLDPPARP